MFITEFFVQNNHFIMMEIILFIILVDISKNRKSSHEIFFKIEKSI